MYLYIFFCLIYIFEHNFFLIQEGKGTIIYHLMHVDSKTAFN